MSTTVGQYPKTPSASAPAQGDHNKQEHGPTPGTPPNEHPPDFVSPRNDAIHDQRAPTAQQNVDTDPSGARANEYPPQAHAGKAGLGPHYYEQHRATLQDRIQGLKEELEGQIKHDEKLQQVCSHHLETLHRSFKKFQIFL